MKRTQEVLSMKRIKHRSRGRGRASPTFRPTDLEGSAPLVANPSPPFRRLPSAGLPPDSSPASCPDPWPLAGGPRLVAAPGLETESDSLTLAELEELYGEFLEAAASLVWSCEDLGPKIGKLRSSVRWDLSRLVLQLHGGRGR